MRRLGARGRRPGRGRPAFTGAVAVLAAATLGACSGNPELQLSRGTGGPSGPPSTAGGPTVTVTQTVTATAAATGPPSPTTPVAPTGPPAGATPLPAAPTIPATFDDAAARAATTRLISGIGELDRQFAQPTGDPSSLTVVDNDLAALLAAGVPSGTDGPSYVARILSLRVFVSAVRSEVGTDRAQAVARYAVVRQETGVLLGQLNVALRASYVLPPPPSPSTTTATVQEP